MLAGDLMRWFDVVTAPAIGAHAANLVPVLIFVGVIWLPLRYLQRRGWLVKI